MVTWQFLVRLRQALLVALAAATVLNLWYGLDAVLRVEPYFATSNGHIDWGNPQPDRQGQLRALEPTAKREFIILAIGAVLWLLISRKQ